MKEPECIKTNPALFAYSRLSGETNAIDWINPLIH